MRNASLERKTNETDIRLSLSLEGTGQRDISTGIGFLDHMLELFAAHSAFDLTLQCEGDTRVDGHHTAEDIGICLGQALKSALGDKKGIRRYASLALPMDEALVLILPILAGASQMLMTKMTPGMSQPAGQDGQQQPGMNNFMKYFFPIFSVYICLTSNAGFALYWVVSNLIATASNFGVNAYFDHADKAAALLEGENTVR